MTMRRAFLAACLATLLAAAALPRAASAQHDSLTIAYPVDVQSWDPTSVTFPAGQSIFKSVFDSPLQYSADLKLSPRIVREWRWQDKEARRLEVTLRDDVTFHDGSRLTTRSRWSRPSGCATSTRQKSARWLTASWAIRVSVSS